MKMFFCYFLQKLFHLCSYGRQPQDQHFLRSNFSNFIETRNKFYVSLATAMNSWLVVELILLYLSLFKIIQELFKGDSKLRPENHIHSVKIVIKNRNFILRHELFIFFINLDANQHPIEIIYTGIHIFL